MIKTGLLIAPARHRDFFAKFVKEVDSSDVGLVSEYMSKHVVGKFLSRKALTTHDLLAQQ